MASARMDRFRGRFIVEDDFRPVGDRPGEADAFAHPAESSWGLSRSIPPRPTFARLSRRRSGSRLRTGGLPLEAEGDVLWTVIESTGRRLEEHPELPGEGLARSV